MSLLFCPRRKSLLAKNPRRRKILPDFALFLFFLLVFLAPLFFLLLLVLGNFFLGPDIRCAKRTWNFRADLSPPAACARGRAYRNAKCEWERAMAPASISRSLIFSKSRGSDREGWHTATPLFKLHHHVSRVLRRHEKQHAQAALAHGSDFIGTTFHRSARFLLLLFFDSTSRLRRARDLAKLEIADRWGAQFHVGDHQMPRSGQQLLQRLPCVGFHLHVPALGAQQEAQGLLAGRRESKIRMPTSVVVLVASVFAIVSQYKSAVL